MPCNSSFNLVRVQGLTRHACMYQSANNFIVKSVLTRCEAALTINRSCICSTTIQELHTRQAAQLVGIYMPKVINSSCLKHRLHTDQCRLNKISQDLRKNISLEPDLNQRPMDAYATTVHCSTN